MTATNSPTTTRTVRHPEPSAAYHAREAANAVMTELDRFRVGQPLAARLAEALLVSELATRMALRELKPSPAGWRPGMGTPTAAEVARLRAIADADVEAGDVFCSKPQAECERDPCSWCIASKAEQALKAAIVAEGGRA